MPATTQRFAQARALRAVRRATPLLESLEDRRLMSTASGHSRAAQQRLDDLVSGPRHLERSTLRAGLQIAPSPHVNPLEREGAHLVNTANTLKAELNHAEPAVDGNNGVLNSLGNNSAVKAVDQGFQKLSQSSTVKTMGNKLQQFGDSVASSFKHLF
jgi:hypothetical protein